MSVYANSGSSSGSPYAQSGTSNGSAYAGGSGGGKPKSKGGGLLGTVEHGAHWAAGKAGLAAHDLKTIPGGLVHIGGEVVHNDISAGRGALHGDIPGAIEQVGPDWENPVVKGLIKGQISQTKESVVHPLRDPFQTITTLAPFVSAAGSVGLRAAEAAEAAKAGGTVADVGKALVKKPDIKPRLLKSGEDETALHPSHNPAMRIVQHGYDKIVQSQMDTNPEGKVAAHGQRRIGGAKAETARYQERMREAPAAALEGSSKKLFARGKPGQNRVNQAALELTTTNTPPEAAAAYHLDQAAKGVTAGEKLASGAEMSRAEKSAAVKLRGAVERNRTVARLYQTVADRGLLKQNPDGDVIVNHVDHPKLAQADLALARVQGKGDEALVKYGVRSPEALQAAVDAPGRYRAGAHFEEPTPGKLGKPSASLLGARSQVARLQALHDRATAKIETDAAKSGTADQMVGHKIVGDGKVVTPPGGARAERIGAALSVAKDRLASMEETAAGRVKQTGVIGGETARPGRGHISYASSEKKAPTSTVAQSPGPVIGEAKAPISSHANQGVNIAHGLVPEDVTGQAARHYRSILRFVNTTERRNSAIRTGVDVRRSDRDVLVRVPGEEHAKIPNAVEEALGRKKPTVDDLAGLNAALDEYRQTLVPGLSDKFAADGQHPVGTTAADAAAARGLDAPGGYKWVDKGVLGDLARPSRNAPGRIARGFDNANSAVTALTVYFKVGHIGTRVLTNASTALIEGSASPLNVGKSFRLWRELSPEEQQRALAAAGQHGYAAMPHTEGRGAISRAVGVTAKTGANFWARHADVPFRFASIAYEARKAGFDTPARFRDLLDKLENPEGLDAAQTAKVEWVAKRANRSGIAYDRLNSFERQYIARGMWFFNWVKGATMFAGHTLVEHPYKSGVLGAGAVDQRKRQEATLGDLPSYEQGLLSLGSGPRPRVTDLSTFSPFSTPSDILNAAARPKEISGFLNPALGAADNLINGTNSFGAPTNTPVTAALGDLVSPTPEAQILTAWMRRKQNQSTHMFETTPKSALLRALVGPAMPRRVNVAAAHSAAARERAGR